MHAHSSPMFTTKIIQLKVMQMGSGSNWPSLGCVCIQNSKFNSMEAHTYYTGCYESGILCACIVIKFTLLSTAHAPTQDIKSETEAYVTCIHIAFTLANNQNKKNIIPLELNYLRLPWLNM